MTIVRYQRRSVSPSRPARFLAVETDFALVAIRPNTVKRCNAAYNSRLAVVAHLSEDCLPAPWHHLACGAQRPNALHARGYSCSWSVPPGVSAVATGIAMHP